jgi:hypothetical protein
MADVFEEEEPEEEKGSSKETSPTALLQEPEPVEEPKIQIVETDSKQTGPSINWNFNDGLGFRTRTANSHDTQHSHLLWFARLSVQSDLVRHPPIRYCGLVCFRLPCDAISSLRRAWA